MHKDDLEEVKKATQKITEGKEFDIEYRIVTTNGIEKYVHEKTKVIYDENKNPIKMVGIIQDITQQKMVENNLKILGDNLNQAQRVAGVGSWKYDVIKDEFYGSEEMYRIYGVDPLDFKNDFNKIIRLTHPEDQFKAQIAMEQLLAGKPCKIEFRIPQTDGTIKYVIGRAEAFFEDGQVVSILGTLQDITKEKVLQMSLQQAQEEITKMQRKFQVLVKESSDVFEIIEPDGTIKYISEASEKVIGYRPEERIGKNLFDYYEGEDLKKLKEMVDFVLKDSGLEVQGDVTLKTKKGQDISLEVHMQNLINEPTVEGIVINFRDITGRVEMESQLQYIATHDLLTGLPNRDYFNKQLKIQCQQAKEKQTLFALMLLDVDGFGYVNDALGYQIGDQLIIQISQRLKIFMGDEKFLCRYSSDQFTIIVPGLSTLEEYKIIAKDIKGLFLQPFKVDNYELNVTISMGISIYPEDADDADLLIKYANITLLRAENEGRNRFKFYSSDIDIHNYKQFVLRNDIRKTLEKGQFKVYYQPIVNMKTNAILAAEALVRWEHPDWGIVSPNEFISLAEESGFIIDVGKWILKEICRNYKQWLNEGLPDIKVSVNFSGIQFFENNFVGNVKHTLDQFGLDPHFLVMEITESVLMENNDKVKSDIQHLQSWGVQIALDDFGTGFSSLSYLSSFNIDILKIDGSFIRNIPFDETNTAITKSVINLAKELKIKLVAEGIENWEQLAYLKKLKCYIGQGYIYRKPLPLEDFKKVLIKKKCKPEVVKDTRITNYEQKRKYFRIEFHQFLEAKMTILELKGKKINVGDTKVLVKNLGPGGLCFICNIQLPVEKHIILKFVTQLLEIEIKACGYPVWIKEVDDNLYEYGIEFTIDENERMNLIKILNQVQIKIRNNILFAEGNFVSVSPAIYFKFCTT